MDYREACNILDIPLSLFNHNNLNTDYCIDFDTLRKAYYKSALLYHPDRNLTEENEIYKQKFQKIGEAYSFLESYIKVNKECVNNHKEDSGIHDERSSKKYKGYETSFFDIKECINKFIAQIDIEKASLNAFDGLNINTAIDVFNYIDEYHELIGIKKDLVESLREVVKNKTQHDKIITVRPTINNILNNDIFQIKYNDKIYYVPVWHDELRYTMTELCNKDTNELCNKDTNDTSCNSKSSFDVKASLVIKCVPELEDNIMIDHNNNLFVNITINSIQELFKDSFVNVSIGEGTTHSFAIPVNELKICKQQIYTIPEKGISLINSTNIYEIKKKGNIIINITILE